MDTEGSFSDDDKIRVVRECTGVTAEVAREYLEGNDWDPGMATEALFEDRDDNVEETTSQDPDTGAEPDQDYHGPRTLDGRPVPGAASDMAEPEPAKKEPKKKGVTTLQSLSGLGEDDDKKKKARSVFTGGEKSGLAVQDPARRDRPQIINDILGRAQSDDHRGAERTPLTQSRFHGSGQTLGGDGVESRTIPAPHPEFQRPAQEEQVIERTIHFWNDGFSIDEGELRRFDDPANHADLQTIREGRAPLRLLNVAYNQRVDVKIEQHHDEDWRQLPKKYKPFGGSGRRLGSPVPGEVAATSALPAPVESTRPAAHAASVAPAPTSGADLSQPTLSLRIQMPDGTRLPARFNTSQTVGDVYQFVSFANPAVNARPHVLTTTFPNKDHSDKSLALGDVPEFKKGATAIVKWL